MRFHVFGSLGDVVNFLFPALRRLRRYICKVHVVDLNIPPYELERMGKEHVVGWQEILVWRVVVEIRVPRYESEGDKDRLAQMSEIET